MFFGKVSQDTRSVVNGDLEAVRSVSDSEVFNFVLMGSVPY